MFAVAELYVQARCIGMPAVFDDDEMREIQRSFPEYGRQEGSSD